MAVDETVVGMAMNMRLAARLARTVGMLMMLVVDMGMGMRQRLMEMFVIMAFDQMEP